MKSPQDCSIFYPDFNRRVNLASTGELVPAFASIMRNWKQEQGAGLSGEPDMIFSRHRHKYDWRITYDGLCADDLDGKPDNPGDATCDFHYELYRWYRSAFPRHLCLHAASCIFATGAVIFPTTFESGKSVLSVALAARGLKVMADDVIALDVQSRELVALGLMPRLRLPLPLKAMGADLARFVTDRQGLSGRRDTYVSLEDRVFCGLGERSVMEGLVILNRSQKYLPARLTAVGHAEALRSLIGQNFNTTIEVQTIFAALKAVVTGGRNFKLTYSDPGEACAVLEKEFGNARV
jgi:hypothetical protein